MYVKEWLDLLLMTGEECWGQVVKTLGHYEFESYIFIIFKIT